MEDEKKGFDQGQIAVCMILVGFVGMFLSTFLIDLLDLGSLIFMVIAFFSGIIGAIMIMIEKSNDKAAHIANINEFQKEYDEYADTLGIVKSDAQVTLLEMCKYNFEVEIPQYLWIFDDCINLFPMVKYYKNYETSSTHKPDVSELKLKSISIDSILYFEEVGELRKYAVVSGGGTSLKGALLGYAIAEDIGAIIGSREPITTTVISEDDRRIELIYKNRSGEIENLEFAYDAYDVFKKLIPLKEFRKIVSLSTVQSTKDNTIIGTQKSPTVKEKLKQLNELKAEGLITEGEFSEQKKKILESI